MTPRESLLAQAAQRILITDGAFGTEIQNWKLTEADYAGSLGLAKDQKGNNDILALTKPEVPESIHRAYFAAGADIEARGPAIRPMISQDTQFFWDGTRLGELRIQRVDILPQVVQSFHIRASSAASSTASAAAASTQGTARGTIAATPRIATCGTFSTGVNASMPNAPRLLTVQVAPPSRSGLIIPAVA